MRFITITLLFITSLYSCNFTKGIEIDASKIDDYQYIANKIEQNSDKVDMEIDDLAITIDICNENISTIIDDIKSDITRNLAYSQTIANNSDTNEIKQQIESKKQAIKSAKNNLIKTLEKIGIKGIFFTKAKQKSIFEKKEITEKRAEESITPQAIESINGIYMKTLSTIKDNRLKDTIMQKISGRVIMDSKLLSKLDRKNKELVYLAVVKVLPLKKEVVKLANNNYTKSYYIKNENQESDFIPQKYTQDFKKLIKRKMKIIEKENALQYKRQKKAIATYNKTIKRNEQEILELKSKLEQKKKILKNVYNELSLKCKINCIKQANAKIIQNIKNLNQEIFYEKDGELMYSAKTYVQTEGNPLEDISKHSVNMLKQMIQTYSKIESFLSVTTIENNKIVKDKTNQEKSLFRDLEKFYIYINPRTENGFDVTLVTKFITKKTKNNSGYKYKKRKIKKVLETVEKITIKERPKLTKKISIKKIEVKVTKKIRQVLPFNTLLGKNKDGWDKSIFRGNRSYSKNTTNTVKDNLTGLIWQKKGSEDKYTYEGGIFSTTAEEYCQDLELDDYDDWRLPTFKELYYLSDRMKVYPSIDENFFESYNIWYWSNTKVKYDSSRVWFVHSYDGGDSNDNISSSNYVRCVR